MISVIIPCYNSESYILNCIDSIRRQSNKEWELIIVDDSSSDNTWNVCKQVSENDQRVVLIKNTGHGVSAARNTGIRCAKGEYICFVDSDDWLEPNALETMLAGTESAQITSGSYQKKYDDGRSETCTLPSKIIDQEAFIISLFDSRNIYQGYCWGKLFKTSIIKDHRIFFDADLAYNEDRLFVLEYAMHIKNAALSSTTIYNYRQHSNSAMSLAKNRLKVQNIHNEIASADKMKKLLNGKYPKGAAWMNYNLLKKAYWWKHEARGQENMEVLADKLIKDLASNVWLSRDIDVVSKIKLLKNKFLA